LQDLQSQRRFEGASLCSSPSRWSTTRKRVDPHRAHCFGPGGAQRCARYRWPLSVMAPAGLRQKAPQEGDGVIPPAPLPPRRRPLGFL
jgi:hypothetical protein